MQWGKKGTIPPSLYCHCIAINVVHFLHIMCPDKLLCPPQMWRASCTPAIATAVASIVLSDEVKITIKIKIQNNKWSLTIDYISIIFSIIIIRS